MKFTSDSFRQFYLNDLQTLPDPEHDRHVKVRNIQPWLDIESTCKESFIDLSQIGERRVFAWSDLHFYHNNIIRYSGRPFEDVDNMNQQLIERYNSVVQDGDIVVFGGDIAFKNDSDANAILDQLKGYKIQIVGNHDIDRKGKLKKLNFDETHLCLCVDVYGHSLLFTHYPLYTVPVGYVNVHGHIHDRPAPSERHLNICVEHTNYAPALLCDLLKDVK